MADTRDLVKRQFGAHAQHYVTSPDHAQGESLERMLELVQPRAEWQALDIATGGGHTARAFAPRVRQVTATDLTARMLTAAEKFIRGPGITNMAFCEAEAAALPFAEGEFDLVTCRVAPHHFPDCAWFVREMARVLKPGGVAAMIDNVVPQNPAAARHINALEKLRDPSHNWAYTQADWLGFFEAAGFEVTRAETFRKARDFDFWSAMMSVDQKTRTQLRVLLRHAPAPAREALAPEYKGEKITFYLTEVLIIGQRHERSRT